MITKNNLSEKLADILNDEDCPYSAPIEMLDIFIDVLTDEQKNKYFTLKESLNIKKVFKLAHHQQV